MSSANQPISNKLVCSLIFTKMSREEYLWSTCSKSCKSAHGYTNLITHLQAYHPSYLEDASRAAKDRNALCVRVVDDETRNIFRWCEWVVMDRLPLRFVDERRVPSDFEGVTKMLQRSTLAVRRQFDQVIQRYLKMRPRQTGLHGTASCAMSRAIDQSSSEVFLTRSKRCLTASITIFQ
ncbi:hypothetical protein PHMEG_00024158 [Phytophthora megakarya]|uniref:BED-type domain-containing protein n=1 Tax=Phytophthora megakarya TaxID=4795 RepID=A0A225VGV8_9STRA|nr:hypothetical protein PHMEG_00024158 [Phytophthora megakarya]